MSADPGVVFGRVERLNQLERERKVTRRRALAMVLDEEKRRQTLTGRDEPGRAGRSSSARGSDVAAPSARDGDRASRSVSVSGSALAGDSTPPGDGGRVRDCLPAGAVNITDPTYLRIRAACCPWSPIDLDEHAARATLDAVNAREFPRHPTSSGETASVVRASGRLPEEVTE